VEPNSIAVVLNPNAGSGKTLAALPKVHEVLKELGRPYHIHLTERPGDGEVSAKRFAQDGASLVLSVGGDGTIYEVVNGLCQSGMTVPMGVVPAGNGSDFARTIGTPKRIEDSVHAACAAVPRAIDAGRATFADGSTRHFINIAGLGFDAIVASRASRTKFLPGANLPYLAAAMRTLATFRNFKVTIEVDGDALSTYAVFVQVANAKYMGGGYKIVPSADIEDGMLDLAIVGDLSKPDLLRTLPTVYGGKHINHPKFRHIRARKIRIESIEPALVQLDGEIAGGSPVTFDVMPAALMLAG
jgi:YegS/Rv2252/BmrU family lipid kinase